MLIDGIYRHDGIVALRHVVFISVIFYVVTVAGLHVVSGYSWTVKHSMRNLLCKIIC